MWSTVFAVIAFVAGLEALIVGIYVSQPAPCTLISALWTAIPWAVAIVVFLAGAIAPCTRAVYAFRRRREGVVVMSDGGGQSIVFGVFFSLAFAVLLAIATEVLAHQVCGAAPLPGWTATMLWIASPIAVLTLGFTLAWLMSMSSLLCASCTSLGAGPTSTPACLGAHGKRAVSVAHNVALSLVGVGAIVTAVLLINYFDAALPLSSLVVHTLPLIIALGVYMITCAMLILSYVSEHVDDAMIMAGAFLVALGLFLACLLLGNIVTLPHATLWPVYVSCWLASALFLLVTADVHASMSSKATSSSLGAPVVIA
jgi:hypothetical protein